MKIKKALFSKGKSAFFFDDQKAIKSGAEQDGFIYKGNPVTDGFQAIRVGGEAISVILILEDGQIAVGDCAAVQYSGAGGRDPLFLAETYIPFLNKNIKPLLEGMDISGFAAMADHFEEMKFDGKKLHTAIRYGLSQALLDACAKNHNKMKCEVICDEYRLPYTVSRIPIFSQTGDNRYENVDKMILKNSEVLPHGLINNIDTKLGRNGELLKEYIEWLVKRTGELKTSPSYLPDIHIDVYGTIGSLFNYDVEKICNYLASLEKHAGNHNLYIEGPVDVGEKNRQIDVMAQIKKNLVSRGSRVKTVADEWCNTYEDIKDFTDADACDMVQIKTPDLGGIQNIIKSVLYCKEHGMEAYQGGTCNETDISSRTCVHVAMASRPERILAKPGMGFDEGYTITNNEMERILAVLRYKKEAGLIK